MSTFLSAPWLAAYLLDLGQTLGADIAGAKPCTKSQKCQIIRFLTDRSNGPVWGMLSDGEWSIPVKLTREAAEKDRELYDGPLPDYCILSLQEYKLIHTRTPVGGKSGLEKDPRLVIECTKYTRSMRVPETILGTPKSVSSHSDLEMWSEGLKQAGGAGNVLKDRLQAAPIDRAASPPKEPKYIARSKAHLPDEIFDQLVNQPVWNDMVSSPPPRSEVLISDWSPTPERRPERIRPSQVLPSDDDEGPSSSTPVSYEQPYPTQLRKVPPLESKRLPKDGTLLVPDSQEHPGRALAELNVNVLISNAETEGILRKVNEMSGVLN